jgi:hypothetical protein
MTQRCTRCTASLSYLVGDVTPYELINPLEGGPMVLLPHSEERCRFHQFLTPELRATDLGADRAAGRELAGVASAACWVRTDVS